MINKTSSCVYTLNQIGYMPQMRMSTQSQRQQPDWEVKIFTKGKIVERATVDKIVGYSLGATTFSDGAPFRGRQRSRQELLVRQKYVLSRSHSTPPDNTRKLAPEVRRFDNLQHPLSPLNKANPGAVMISRNNPNNWTRVPCTPGSLLENIEIRPEKKLLNLTGSAQFCTGALSQTQKRELQNAVTSIVMGYNAAVADKSRTEATGPAPITIHENHLEGDGNIYPDRQIPRKPNERDYDYYHTLGVSFAENGKMMPHYHLEFNDRFDRQNVGVFLNSLRNIGKTVLGKEILGEEEIATILAKLPENNNGESVTSQDIKERRLRLPNEEVDDTENRVRLRDDAHGAFLSLSSQNTELAAGANLRNAHMNSYRPAEPLFECFLRNAHMNSYRSAEPLFECFSTGHVSVMDDVQKIERHSDPASPENQNLDTGELLSIHNGLIKAIGELTGFNGAPQVARDELLYRFKNAKDKVKELLKTS